MDREHVKGAAKKFQRSIENTAGKVTGDKKLFFEFTRQRSHSEADQKKSFTFAKIAFFAVTAVQLSAACLTAAVTIGADKFPDHAVYDFHACIKHRSWTSFAPVINGQYHTISLRSFVT